MTRKKLGEFLKHYYPALLLIGIYIAIFYKVFFLGLVPFPADLLVTRFFPYSGGGWEGYSPFITQKEFIGADVFRQLYTWRVLAMDLLKEGIIPLWNPYAASGKVLIANMQSAVFYPLNILFFLFENRTAWIIYVMLQPLMSFYFMYLFIRSLKLSRYAALLCALAFPFIGTMVTQFEWGTVAHAFSWLPLILFGLNQYFDLKERKYLLLSALGITCSSLAGYIQPTVYVLIITIVFFGYHLYRDYQKVGKQALRQFYELWFFLLGLGSAAVLFVPLYEAYSLSARHAYMEELFHKYQFAYQHLITVFAPDFFGNPATLNFWGKDYAEFMLWIGIVMFFFTLLGLWYRRNDLLVRWVLGLGIVAFLFASPTFLSELLVKYNVMVLSTGVPARSILITEFCMLVIAGFGIDYFFSKRLKLLSLWIIFPLIYVLIWGVVLSSSYLWADSTLVAHLAIVKRNLILPTLIAVAISTLFFLRTKISSERGLLFIFLAFFLIAGFEYAYFLQKYASFSPPSYIFPEHPVITYLQRSIGVNRIYGYDTAALGTNLPSYWRLYYPETYDSIYPRRYGELVAATRTGKLMPEIPRSDITFPNSLPAEDSYPKQTIMNLLGVKYALDKNDLSQGTFEPEYGRFPSERYTLIYQLKKWKIYQNKKALPRAAFFTDYEQITDDHKIIERLFSPDFDYRKKLIIKSADTFFTHPVQAATASAVSIIKYKPNEVILSVDAKESGFVYLSDVNFPGWNATVDEVRNSIYEADYAFRAVPVSSGKHTIVFRYQPLSFYVGIIISGISLIIFTLLLFFYLIGGKKHAKKT